MSEVKYQDVYVPPKDGSYGHYDSIPTEMEISGLSHLHYSIMYFNYHYYIEKAPKISDFHYDILKDYSRYMIAQSLFIPDDENLIKELRRRKIDHAAVKHGSNDAL